MLKYSFVLFFQLNFLLIVLIELAEIFSDIFLLFFSENYDLEKDPFCLSNKKFITEHIENIINQMRQIIDPTDDIIDIFMCSNRRNQHLKFKYFPNQNLSPFEKSQLKNVVEYDGNNYFFNEQKLFFTNKSSKKVFNSKYFDFIIFNEERKESIIEEKYLEKCCKFLKEEN
jgi:hypothetical protein